MIIKITTLLLVTALLLISCEDAVEIDRRYDEDISSNVGDVQVSENMSHEDEQQNVQDDNSFTEEDIKRDEKSDRDEEKIDETQSDRDANMDDEKDDSDELSPEETTPQTGQNDCYNNSTELDSCPAAGEPFYGQDGNFSNGERTFKQEGAAPEKVVTDTLTELMWQKTLPENYAGCSFDGGKSCKYFEAEEYCKNLIYGNFEDWRLPSATELKTIVNYGNHNPAAYENGFLSTPAAKFWTSTELKNDFQQSWTVDFRYGSSSTRLHTMEAYIRCVRGAEYKPEIVFDDIVGADNKTVVIDTHHKQGWSYEIVENKTWEEALLHCEILEYGDYDDWRLPNINELGTLINYSKLNAASNFPNEEMASSSFWSSTTNRGLAENAFRIYFYSGAIDSIPKTDKADLICVR